MWYNKPKRKPTGAGFMGRYKQGENREQLRIEPLCFDEMISEDNPVRAIDAIVEMMGIPSLGFKYGETKTTGRMPYDPKDMFKMYAYSYYNNIRSSRKIEREAHRNIELMWLVNEIKPDHKTIANFRKENKKAIKAAFKKFTMICDELGLISKEIVAVDGSKFRACNGRMRYHSKGKIAEKLLHYQEAAEKYMNLLEQSDSEENENPPNEYTRDELKERLAKINKRAEELEAIQEKVEAEGTLYLTDPEARLMRTHNGGGDISHNVLTATETKNHFIVAVDVTSDAVDYGQLHNISKQARENLELEEEKVLISLADKGFYSGEQFKKCKEDYIMSIAPHPEKGGNQERGYTKGYFSYDKETDTYTCPKGQILTRAKQRKPNPENIRYRNLTACANCPAREKCSPSTRYRTITRGEFDDYSDEVDAFTKANKAIYSTRKSIAEHPFGTVKRALGFTYFLTRGTENVRTESLLHFLAYNMKRLINIMGAAKLQAVMQT
jgi:transposase